VSDPLHPDIDTMITDLWSLGIKPPTQSGILHTTSYNFDIEDIAGRATFYVFAYDRLGRRSAFPEKTIGIHVGAIFLFNPVFTDYPSVAAAQDAGPGQQTIGYPSGTVYQDDNNINLAQRETGTFPPITIDFNAVTYNFTTNTVRISWPQFCGEYQVFVFTREEAFVRDPLNPDVDTMLTNVFSSPGNPPFQSGPIYTNYYDFTIPHAGKFTFYVFAYSFGSRTPFPLTGLTVRVNPSYPDDGATLYQFRTMFLYGFATPHAVRVELWDGVPLSKYVYGNGTFHVGNIPIANLQERIIYP
jgi:hypothetical protein